MGSAGLSTVDHSAGYVHITLNSIKATFLVFRESRREGRKHTQTANRLRDEIFEMFDMTLPSWWAL